MSIDDNNGSVFYNTDFSKSFNQLIETSFTKLSAHRCSEVLLINRSGQDMYIYDNDYFSDDNRLLLENNDSMVLRGVSDCDKISARTDADSGTLYYRAQYYSNMSQR